MMYYCWLSLRELSDESFAAGSSSGGLKSVEQRRVTRVEADVPVRRSASNVATVSEIEVTEKSVRRKAVALSPGAKYPLDTGADVVVVLPESKRMHREDEATATDGASSGVIHQGGVVGGKSWYKKKCPMTDCESAGNNIRRHVTSTHLQKFMGANRADPGKMVDYVSNLATSLGHESIPDLFTWYKENNAFPSSDFNHVTSIIDQQAMCECQRLITGEEPTDKPILSPPNCIASLFHWRSIICVQIEVSNATRSDLQKAPSVRLVDAHCHLYALHQKVKKSTGVNHTYAELVASTRPGDSVADVDTVIAVYCFPNTEGYPNSLERQKFGEKDGLSVYCCYGVHPKAVCEITQEIYDHLTNMLQSSTCVALGEVGLDYSVDRPSRSEQENHAGTYAEYGVEPEFANRASLPPFRRSSSW